jgi:DNA processing protein
VTEAAEILQIIGIDNRATNGDFEDGKNNIDLPGPSGKILNRLDMTPRHCDELAGESGLTPMELSAILLHLELCGYAERLPGGRYIRGRRAHLAT